jgi:hypothetical protein
VGRVHDPRLDLLDHSPRNVTEIVRPFEVNGS